MMTFSRLPKFRVLRSLVGAGLVSLLIGFLVIGGKPSPAPAQFSAEELERNPNLTPSVRRLILAYENYLKHFPDSPQGKEFVIDIAERFRSAGDNETAIVAQKRVLARPDITQAERAYAYEQIMECYRLLGKFDEQEEWARRMAAADVGREKQQQAKDFIFAAGYNRAKALEDSSRLMDAAEAYERLAVMNPDHGQASEAMLKAADLYDTAGDKARAARTFERFYYTYPDYRDPASGKGALVALENAANLYAEINDYRHTADAAERILAAAPDHPNRQMYMNNLAAIYSLLKDYNNAIRVRQQYVALYPNDPKSGTYQWDIAQFRGLAGQRQQQLAEYEAFIRSYPNDFRAIEANLIVGQDKLAQRDRALARGARDEAERLQALARANFEKAFTLHDSLEALRQGSGDLLHALPAAVEVAKMDSAAYYSISLRGSPSFSQDSTRKWESLRQAEGMYRKIANYAYPPTTFAALYQRGRLFEDFSAEYLKQPRPDSAVTYDEINKVFFINEVSKQFLQVLAIPAYQTQMLEFYETNRSSIDTAAATLPDTSLRTAHLPWLDMARERLAAIPRTLDSLTLNTIAYDADLTVLKAQEKIPQTIAEKWPAFERQQQERYRTDPRLRFGDKQEIFDRGVAPVVYGSGPQDSLALVNYFQRIIADGERLGASRDWVLYNKGRLRLVYGARSSYFSTVTREGMENLGFQLDTLRQESNGLTNIIARLPKLDLAAIGPPPERPDLTPPAQPVRPNVDLRAPENRAIALRFIEDFNRFKRQVEDLKYRAVRYQREVERYRARVAELQASTAAQFRGILEEARTQSQEFSRVATETQRYRMAIELVADRTRNAYERDIAFGDSVGYAEKDRRAVRDSALAANHRISLTLDSLYSEAAATRRYWEERRDSTEGGEASPAFQVINNLVTQYAAVADSFRVTAVRSYMYTYKGRDSIFTVGLDHPIVQYAIQRLRVIDPTFGVQTVPLTFTYVTEDSTGLWRVSSTIDRQNPDAWRQVAFNDSTWVPAVKGTMPRVEFVQAADTTAGAAVQPEPAAGEGAVTAEGDTTAEAAPQVAEVPKIVGFPPDNLNMTDLWSPTYADTVYFRYKLQLPPRWDELPDSLSEPGRKRPVVRKASITITADDDYVVYVNGEVTPARDTDARVDWKTARTYEVLKDQWTVGDTANIIAIRARNEKRLNRIPDTDTATYGVMARIDIEMDVPLYIYEALYRPPEPEPTFVLAFTPDDSVKMADTTGTYFRTAAERERWQECRTRTLRAAWEDTVLIPWRAQRDALKKAQLDSEIVRLTRWIRQRQEEARGRIATAAAREAGLEESGESPAPDAGTDSPQETPARPEDTGGP